MSHTMPTCELTLTRYDDGFHRCSWYDDAGQRHAKSFGRDPRRAARRFADFYAAWRSDARVRNPSTDGPLTVRELGERFATYARGYYNHKDGSPTGEARAIAYAFAPLVELYGDEPVESIGPKRLKAARARMVEAGLCLKEVNKRTRKIRQVFCWAAGEELIPGSTWHALKAVRALRAGATVEVRPNVYEAPRQTDAVAPVPDADVCATCERLPATVAAMVRLQWLTGMRPQEVCLMRQRDITASGPTWEYRPPRHKLEHLEDVDRRHTRVVLLGPRAQAVLRPFLSRDTAAYLFSPREACRQRYDQRETHRHQPVVAPITGRRHGEHYTTNAYGRAIYYAIRAVNAARVERDGDRAILMERWGPNRLRHNALTRLRAEFGLDVAQVVAGHSSADVTQVYAERNIQLAARAMERVG